VLAVVGAGITGLALAHELARRGAEFLVLEAAPRPGGTIRSTRAGGTVLELGPQRVRLTPAVRQLVHELGLERELAVAPPGLPLLVCAGGRLHTVPADLAGLARTRLLSWRGKLRLLAEPLTAGLRPEETAAAYFERKAGRQAYRRVLGPLYGGIYAGDPARMPARFALAPALRELGVRRSLLAAWLRRAGPRGALPPACSFREGLATLADTLCRRHADRIRLATPARGLRRAGARLAVETDAGPVEADHVVLTVPADAAATLLAELAPDLARRLARLTYNPVAIVHLRSDVDLRGLGYQVAFGEPLETRGVTFHGATFGRTGLYTAFLGGAQNPELAAAPDDVLARTAEAEFERVTGHGARALHVTRTRVPAWDASWAALDGAAPPPGVHLAASYESRPGIPGRLARARELADRLAGPERAG